MRISTALLWMGAAVAFIITAHVATTAITAVNYDRVNIGSVWQ